MMLRNKMVIKKLFKANNKKSQFKLKNLMKVKQAQCNQLQLNRLKNHNLLMKNCEKSQLFNNHFMGHNFQILDN